MSKYRPAPLRDLQIAAQADQSCRYLVFDTHSSLPAPAYPFDPPLQQDHSAWQLLDSLSSNSPLVQVKPSLSTFWNDSLGNRLSSAQHYRPFAPPIGPSALSPRARVTECSPKRSGRTFALVPTQVNGKHVSTHAVVDPKSNDSKQDFPSASGSPPQEGLPEDMQDILQQLDDLASWIKTTSPSNCDVTVHATPFTGHPATDNKGKNRSLSTSNGCNIHRDFVGSSNGAKLGDPKQIPSFPTTDCRSDGFIYVPDCNTPEFLVGSSSSPIAYPVCGYSSHPSRYSPHPPGASHDIPYYHRFLERRSAPCPLPTSSPVAPPPGKTSFRTLFQRSSYNTTAVARPGIPAGHVPVENALRQGKKMRLPWLRI